MKIRAHKMGSVVSRLSLDPEIEISRMVEARSGQVVVVRALEEKRVYDQIELTTGRMAHVAKTLLARYVIWKLRTGYTNLHT